MSQTKLDIFSIIMSIYIHGVHKKVIITRWQSLDIQLGAVVLCFSVDIRHSLGCFVTRLGEGGH